MTAAELIDLPADSPLRSGQWCDEDDFAFDEPSHTYRFKGSKVPSVTTIINAIMPQFQADEYYLERGRAIHHGCALINRNALDWSTVAPEIEPRLRAWVKFRNDNPQLYIGCIEKPMVHPTYRFAGTMDCNFVNSFKFLLCDLKSSIAPQVRVQLGGYSLLWSSESKQKAKEAVAVELRDNGTYSTMWMNESELRRAEQIFLATLTVYNFMSEHNLLKGKP